MESLQKPLFPLVSFNPCARGLRHGKGAAEVREEVVLQTKVRARSLSAPLWPLHLNILLISANRLFICRLRFNSPVSVPPTLSWQARVCVKAVSQDWANGSRSAVSLACVEGICILKTELIPFLWSALVGSCPRSVFCPSSPPPSLLEGISEQRGPWVRAGSTDLACRGAGCSLCSHTATQGDPG